MDKETNINFSSVNLDSSFIKKYLGKTKSDFITCYIYAQSIEKPTIEGVSEGLEIQVSSVYEAALFWGKEELWEVDEGVISFPKKENIKKFVTIEQRPQYDPMELSMYAEKNPDVKKLFSMTQKYLGRLLTHNDLSGIFSIYTWVGLSLPVIEKLLEYCAEKNHRNIRYIERVAIDWAENEITTPEAAEEKIRMYNMDFRRIMRAMGQGGRAPIQREEKYMTTWIKEYSIPVEVIEYACEKTVLNTGKAAFAYADKILSQWKENDVRSVEEARVVERKAVEEKKNKVSTSKKVAPKKSKSRFVNFEQRNYDFEEYERRELERISKKE